LKNSITNLQYDHTLTSTSTYFQRSLEVKLHLLFSTDHSKVIREVAALVASATP